MEPRALLFVVLLVACESAAGTGAPCARAAECTSPLVCRLGRCRAECALDRDCPLGATCLFGAESSGACALASEASCTGTSCPEGLVCTASGCRDACTDVCRGDGQCVLGACVPDEVDGGVTDAAPTTDGGLPRPTPCSQPSDCFAPLVCVEVASVQLCAQPCTTASECAGHVLCDPHTRVGGGADVSVCDQDCVPGTDEGCALGTYCSMWNWAVDYTSFCHGVAATAGGEGCPCADGGGSNECLDGLVCGRDNPILTYRCVHACRAGDTCPGGACFVPGNALTRAGERWGFCPIGPTPACAP